jgi:uncharacterized protein HemX
MNTEAVTSDEGAASSFVAAQNAGAAVPWYEILFKTQNLALAMGAIVLAFSGVLGYLVLQNRNAETNSSVSQVTEQEPALGGPYFGGELGAANSNALANASNTSAAANAPAANADARFTCEHCVKFARKRGGSGRCGDWRRQQGICARWRYGR